MAAEPLNRELRDAGAAMLAELDRLGLTPRGALWLYYHGIKEWRYVVVSDLVGILGRRKVYSLVGEALDKIGPVHGLTVFDVHLYEADEVVPRILQGAIGMENGVADLEDCNFDGMQTDAVMYRMLRKRPERDIKLAAASFERSVRNLLAA